MIDSFTNGEVVGVSLLLLQHLLTPQSLCLRSLITAMLSPVTQNIQPPSQGDRQNKKTEIEMKKRSWRYIWSMHLKSYHGNSTGDAECVKDGRCQRDGLRSIKYVHTWFHLKFDYTYHFFFVSLFFSRRLRWNCIASLCSLCPRFPSQSHHNEMV